MKRRTGGARTGALAGLCALGLVAFSLEAPAQGVAKVKDFSTRTVKTDTAPSGFAKVNGSVLFFSKQGKGLFRTDGTQAGTRLVRDIAPALASWETPPHLVTLRGRAYWLQAHDLWTSDGTPEGTRPVLDTPFVESPTPPVVFKGALYFSVGTSLYRSDGTARGTQPFVTARMHVTEEQFASSWRVMGGRLYFSCLLGSGSAGIELCSTDGTAKGTVQVADLGPGSEHGRPQLLGELGGKLLFVAASAPTGSALYATDGTAKGTTALLTVANGWVVDTSVNGFATLKGRAYLPCRTADTGVELCRTDGTVTGTQVLDLVKGSASSDPRDVTVLGHRLYFFASTAQTGFELWSSDGTSAGSGMLTDLYPGSGSSGLRRGLVPVDGGLLFGAVTPNGDGLLWKTDGTAKGTVLVKNLASPEAPGFRHELDLSGAMGFGGGVLFPADDGAHGLELWRSDGTGAGTRMVKDVTPAQRQADAIGMWTVNDRLLLGVYDETGKSEVWRSDGTAEGTQVLSPAMGASPGYPTLLPFGERLLIAHGTRLWMTDGTAEGTVPFKNLPESGVRGDVIPLSATVAVFMAPTPDKTVALWRTDGTGAGTRMISPTEVKGRDLGVSNGRVFFEGASKTLGEELYTSDGTPEGTRLLKDIQVGPKGSQPAGFTPLGTKILFAADDGVVGRELWTTDGTPAGTVLLADLNPGERGSGLSNLQVVGRRGVFWAETPTSRLWTTDGTVQGTRPVGSDVASGHVGGFITWGDFAYFAGRETGTGTELWRTDGTPEGTVRVADLHPGRGSSLPDQLTLVSPSGPLLFAAEEPTKGRELWRLDSPTGVPRLAMDVAAGPASSRPEHLTVNGPDLYFSASDGVGRALFRLPGPGAATRPPGAEVPRP
ncbi:ELWxxDGT repeat protein [Corallococcus aberystwythensis]|uniref:Hyalin n=1 Tax=Corallococcus aberystwythensis TaxID=2316722 RepID=A0A3A8QQZ5_9BACT|nr:ELWxxDGT repeat protein [Corallococcus aberystwythensis]RKH69320.1 hypothetical protein D7W81_11270 [Corallococcus aberystwythensis]